MRQFETGPMQQPDTRLFSVNLEVNTESRQAVWPRGLNLVKRGDERSL